MRYFYAVAAYSDNTFKIYRFQRQRARTQFITFARKHTGSKLSDGTTFEEINPALGSLLMRAYTRKGASYKALRGFEGEVYNGVDYR